MNALLEHFHEAVNTPEDVEKLKKYILQLAMQGKLVEQDPNDEPTSVLLKRIEAERERLIKEKKIKRQKTLSPVEEGEISYEIPHGWEWVRLGTIGEIVGGGTPKTNNPDYWCNPGEGIAWVTPADLGGKSNVFISRGRRDITHLGLEKSSAVLMSKGSVLFSSRAPIGYVAIAENDICTNQGFKSVVPYIMEMNYFIYYYLLFLAGDINSKATGTTFKEVSGREMSVQLFPLPPVNEQKRIVEKIVALNQRCNQLYEELFKEKKASGLLNKSVFSKIKDQSNPNQLEDLRFAIENMEYLCNDKEGIAQLRKSVLSLAIQGKLVKQDPYEEPATILLEKIHLEKEQLIEEKKIKKDKSLSPIKDDEIPFNLPNGWEWSRIGDIYETVSGSTPRRTISSYFKNGTINWVKTTDLNNKIVTRCEEKITEQAVEDANLKVLPPKTVCIAMYGGKGTIGKSGIFGFQSTINQSICALLPSSFMCAEFLHFYILSIRKEWMKFASSTRKDPNINREIIKKFLMPVPPFEEQKRIVKQIQKLLLLINQLDQSIEVKEKREESMIKTLFHNTPSST